MDAALPRDLSLRQVLLRHGGAVLRRHRTPQAQPAVLLPQHLPVLGSQKTAMGDDCRRRALGFSLRHRRVRAVLPPQFLLDKLGPRAHWHLSEHQCYWMGKCCHQHRPGPVDVGDTPIPAPRPEPSLEEEDRRGIDVLRRHIVST